MSSRGNRVKSDSGSTVVQCFRQKDQEHKDEKENNKSNRGVGAAFCTDVDQCFEHDWLKTFSRVVRGSKGVERLVLVVLCSELMSMANQSAIVQSLMVDDRRIERWPTVRQSTMARDHYLLNFIQDERTEQLQKKASSPIKRRRLKHSDKDHEAFSSWDG